MDGLRAAVFALINDREREIDDARLRGTFDCVEDRRSWSPLDGGGVKGLGRGVVVGESVLLKSLGRLFMRQGNPECVLLPALVLRTVVIPLTDQSGVVMFRVPFGLPSSELLD